jgi:hypothetical protein
MHNRVTFCLPPFSNRCVDSLLELRAFLPLQHRPMLNMYRVHFVAIESKRSFHGETTRTFCAVRRFRSCGVSITVWIAGE